MIYNIKLDIYYTVTTMCGRRKSPVTWLESGDTSRRITYTKTIFL